MEEIEEYFVGLYVATFEAIIGSIEARYSGVRVKASRILQEIFLLIGELAIKCTLGD